jgi:hypothetical protein
VGIAFGLRHPSPTFANGTFEVQTPCYERLQRRGGPLVGLL